MEDEADVPETTTEELREVILDEAEPEKKILVGALLSSEERGSWCPSSGKTRMCSHGPTKIWQG